MNMIAALVILAVRPQDDLQEKLAKLQTENEVLRRQLEVVTTQLRDLEDRLAKREPESVVPPEDKGKLLEGKVTAVSGEAGLVVISLGKDQGVGEGMEFTLYRDNSLVAKIRIDRVDRQWSAGKVTVKKDDPRVGDLISGRILNRPLSKEGADQLRDIRRELDEIRAEIRKLTDRLLPSWKEQGLVVEPLSEELRGHFGVEGVIVRRVAEESAAAKRGLQIHDIVTGMSEAGLLEALKKGTPIRILRKGRELEK